MKITHVAEIVNIGHVARILEAEIWGAENVRAILMYNRYCQSHHNLRNSCGWKNWKCYIEAIHFSSNKTFSIIELMTT